MSGNYTAKGSMKQIATEAGCSISTVSRVLNGRQKGFSVCDELNARIIALANHYNYRPNPFLRIMRAEDSNLIAIFDQLQNYSIGLLQSKEGFINTIRQHGFLETGKYVSIYSQESYALPFPVAAALLFDICDPSFLSFLEDREIPYVVLNGYSGTSGLSVRIDEESNTCSVIDALYNAGHRRVAMYCSHKDAGNKHQHYSGIAREAAMHKALIARGMELPPKALTGQFEPDDFLEYAKTVFKPSAVVCYNHSRALGLYSAAIRSGIRIPDDLSIVSLSDDPILAKLPTPIAAMSVSHVKMGIDAAQMIIRRLTGCNDNSIPKLIEQKGRLLRRESIAHIL